MQVNRLSHDLEIYLIAMTEGTNNLRFDLKPPGLGSEPTPVQGHGTAAFLEDTN